MRRVALTLGMAGVAATVLACEGVVHLDGPMTDDPPRLVAATPR